MAAPGDDGSSATSTTISTATTTTTSLPASKPEDQPSFPLFSLLPAELRVEIWRLSCTPRVVEVCYCAVKDRCYSPTPPPAILHVCHESRREGLREAGGMYRRVFATARFGPADPPIYFAPAQDVLYLPRDGLDERQGAGDDDDNCRARMFERRISSRAAVIGYGDAAREFVRRVPGVVDCVHRLAIDFVPPEVRRPWETYNKFCLVRGFSHLDKVFLVLEPVPSRPGSSSSSSGTVSDEDPEYSERQGRDWDRERDRQGGGRLKRRRVDEQIELVDPRDNQDAIRRLMRCVRDSFRYEVGCPVRVMGCEGGADTDDSTSACDEVGLSLIPKAKAMRKRARARGYLGRRSVYLG